MEGILLDRADIDGLMATKCTVRDVRMLLTSNVAITTRTMALHVRKGEMAEHEI